MKKQNDIIKSRPTIAVAEQFDMLFPILEALYDEIKELSKKKQDGVLNTVKVIMINRILDKIKVMLKDDPTVEFLDLLDEVSLPTNSDSVFILAQFKAAMVQFKAKYYRFNGLETTWLTSD